MTTPRRFVCFLILTPCKYLTALTKQDTVRVRFHLMTFLTYLAEASATLLFSLWKSFSQLYTSYALLLLQMAAFLDISSLKVLFRCFTLVSEQVILWPHSKAMS